MLLHRSTPTISHGILMPTRGASSYSGCVCLTLAFDSPATQPYHWAPSAALPSPVFAPACHTVAQPLLCCTPIRGRWSAAGRLPAGARRLCVPSVALRCVMCMSGAIAWPGARRVRNAHQQATSLPASQRRIGTVTPLSTNRVLTPYRHKITVVCLGLGYAALRDYANLPLAPLALSPHTPSFVQSPLPNLRPFRHTQCKYHYWRLGSRGIKYATKT